MACCFPFDSILFYSGETTRKIDEILMCVGPIFLRDRPNISDRILWLTIEHVAKFCDDRWSDL